MSYTDEQYAAIHTHDCNLIVTAGAGSGKTRVLVDRFVALLDAHPDWPLPSLVAVTFTEKAAREMRDRVRQAIEQRIAKATRDGLEGEIQRWRERQAALDSARIGTIHSLCAAIVRANAAELGIDPGFEVLDEIESAIVLNDALDQALGEIGSSNTTQGAARLLTEYGSRTVKDVLRERIALSLESTPKPEDYLDWWRSAYEENAAQVLAALRDESEFADALRWEPPCSDASDKLMQSWALVLTRRHTWLSPDSPVDQLLAALADWADGIKLTGGKVGAWGGKETVDEAKRLLGLIRDKAKSALAQIGDFGEADDKAAELLPLWGEAITCAQAIYQAFKERRRALDFDDLETRTRELLNRPDIAARYQGAEFRHILVDEFQDTNGAQRDIIYGLAGLARPGSLFVVGDPRQSIYQFRGADVSVFETVRQEILARGGREISLDRSFRTHSRLVDGFNAIFANLLVRNGGPMSAYEVELGQKMTAARNAESHHSPCMEFILIDKQFAAEDNSSAEDLRRWEAWTLAQRFRQMVDSGWPAWDKQRGAYRPLLYGDIAVLFQATTSMTLVEEVFKAEAIPYVTIAGKGYYSRPEVWDLLNLLKALYNPFDDLSLAAALRSPLYGLSDDDLFALRLQRAASGARLSLWTALMDSTRSCEPQVPDGQQVAFARESLRRLRGIAGRVSIAELLAQALDETAYLATLNGLPDGSRRCGNVDKLLELARRSKRIALGEFTDYLQDLSDREAREGEALVESEGAVQLMTVHSSKGLEFPVVTLFDASWERGRSDEVFTVDPLVGPACCVVNEDGERAYPFALRMAREYAEARANAERMRLLYVGMTRAQDYVIVSGRTNGKGLWLERLRETLGLALLDGDDEERLIAFPWGDCLLRVPKSQPPPERFMPRGDLAPTSWDRLSAEPVSDYESVAPPISAPVPFDRQVSSRMLTISEIAALGEARASGNLDHFRNQILHDSPPSVQSVAGRAGAGGVSHLVVGEMVHQALRWWRLPGNTRDLRKVLDTYAWERGITDPQMIERAIDEANELLVRTEHSEIVQDIKQASQVYRELPFTLKLGERLISGVIDLLYFSKYQRWHVVDFKTAILHGEDNAAERLIDHSARYHAQVGIYALAVQAMTGQLPDASVHYIRYVRTIRVEPEAWRGVLQNLDGDIAAALAE